MIGEGFLIKPDDYNLENPVEMSIHLASTFTTSRLGIGKWDKENANWIAAENIKLHPIENRISATIHTLGLYALLIQSKPLAIESIKFLPNPFSPDVDTDNDGYPGLSIHLTMSSTFSRTPFVTIKIYNMLGETVRELVEKGPFVKDTNNIVVWDGLTDDGRLARNGRYIIRTEIEDASGQTENTGTVVLIR